MERTATVDVVADVLLIPSFSMVVTRDVSSDEIDDKSRVPPVAKGTNVSSPDRTNGRSVRMPDTAIGICRFSSDDVSTEPRGSKASRSMD